MLSWSVTRNACDYPLLFPPLSKAEETVISAISKLFVESTNKEQSNANRNKTIRTLLEGYCKINQIDLDPSQSNYLVRYIDSNVAGFCGLDELFENDELEEIALIGIDKPVYVYHTKYGWLRTNLYFRNEEGATNIINKIARSLGRRITYQEPKLNAVLPDGSRLHASIPPISNVELTVRKFRKNPLTISNLLNSSVYSAEQLAFLSIVFQLDYNTIIAGNTASGKSSTLNSLFSFVPLNDRIVIIEETPEINIPHAHKVKLLSNANLSISMQHLVEDSLRMRPDRIVIGEVRTKEEIDALISTILSGQARGSYATFHARSSEEVVKRFISQGVLSIYVGSLDYIIVQRRILRYDRLTRRSWEERRCTEIAEVVGNEPTINKIFTFSESNSKIIGSISRSTKLEEIADKLSISNSELFDELSQREQFIINLSKRQLTFEETISELQTFLFSPTKEQPRIMEGKNVQKRQ